MKLKKAVFDGYSEQYSCFGRDPVEYIRMIYESRPQQHDAHAHRAGVDGHLTGGWTMFTKTKIALATALVLSSGVAALVAPASAQVFLATIRLRATGPRRRRFRRMAVTRSANSPLAAPLALPRPAG